jgi:hypothetical protein
MVAQAHRCYPGSMTSLLEKALREASRLPAAEQDRIARVILDEIEDEARWQATFARSQDQLAALAGTAREEIARADVREDNVLGRGSTLRLNQNGNSCTDDAAPRRHR